MILKTSKSREWTESPEADCSGEVAIAFGTSEEKHRADDIEEEPEINRQWRRSTDRLVRVPNERWWAREREEEKEAEDRDNLSDERKKNLLQASVEHEMERSSAALSIDFPGSGQVRGWKYED